MSQPMPPPYPGLSYYPQQVEGMLTRRNVFAVNAIALFLIYLGVLVRLGAGDLTAIGFAHFLVISGAIVGAVASLAGALGSKKTTDMQNLGLLVWAGLLLSFSITVFAWIR